MRIYWRYFKEKDRESYPPPSEEVLLAIIDDWGDKEIVLGSYRKEQWFIKSVYYENLSPTKIIAWAKLNPDYIEFPIIE